MMKKKDLTVFAAVLFFAGACAAQTIDLSGTVTSGSGSSPLANVNVTLKALPALSTTTGADGTYHLTSTAVINVGPALNTLSESRLTGNILEFCATGTTPVTIDIFTASGSKVTSLTQDNILARGIYRVDLAAQRLAPGLYGIRYCQGGVSTVYRYVTTGIDRGPAGRAAAPEGVFSKRTAGTIDTLVFTLSGYVATQVPIASYSGQYDAALQPQSVLPAGMKLIPAGTFTMGSSDGTNWGGAPPHQVTLTSAFYMDSTEVTHANYLSIMKVDPSSFTGSDQLPVDQATWFDAALYCNARSKANGKDTMYTYTAVSGTPGNGCTGLSNIAIDYTKKGYYLPTEAQWEYACRAGTTTEFYWGDQVDGDYCWWYANCYPHPEPVATKIPNSWGLYDMIGNEAEWCNDWYAPYTDASETDPTGPSSGSTKMVRGGSWGNHDVPNFIYTATRVNSDPATVASTNGFRCALPK